MGNEEGETIRRLTQKWLRILDLLRLVMVTLRFLSFGIMDAKQQFWGEGDSISGKQNKTKFQEDKLAVLCMVNSMAGGKNRKDY